MLPKFRKLCENYNQYFNVSDFRAITIRKFHFFSLCQTVFESLTGGEKLKNMKLLYNKVDQEKWFLLMRLVTKEIISSMLSKNRSTNLLMLALEINSSLICS